MAGVHFLAVNYLRGDVGPTLWQKLSDVLGETLTKKNFKNALQRAAQRQLLFSSVILLIRRSQLQIRVLAIPLKYLVPTQLALPRPFPKAPFP